MEGQAGALDRTTLAGFAAIVVIGGTNFISVKFSVAELPPLFGAGVRFAAGALIFLAIARARRRALPRGKAAAGAVIYGLLNFALFYGLMYFALLRLEAGTTSVIMAAAPLVTLTFAVAHGQERFTTRGILGGMLAVAGIALLSLRSLGGDLPVVYLLAAIGGLFAAAEASVLVKGYPRSDPITTNAVGMAIGAVALTAASLALGERWALPQSPRTWVALAWLATVGSVGLFGLFLLVIKRWTASASVYAITLMPVVAVALGAILVGEQVTPEIVAGGALMMAAVYIGALGGGAQVKQAAPAPARVGGAAAVAESP